MIGVMLVEDQTLVREGVRGLIQTTADIRVVAEAADGGAALDLLFCPQMLRPDVILMDIRLPVLSGIEVLRRMPKPGPPVILITTFDDDESLLQGIRAGARGYLLKDVSLERLSDAIRRVHAGESILRPAITERACISIDRDTRTFEALALPEPLTPRETEVLRLMAGGFSNSEIADAFGCTGGTVKNHASSVFSKLGVRDRTRAVLRAIELGWI